MAPFLTWGQIVRLIIRWRRPEQPLVAKEPPVVVESPLVEEPPIPKKIVLQKGGRPVSEWKVGHPDSKGLWEEEKGLARGMMRAVNGVRQRSTNARELRAGLRLVIRQQQRANKLSYQLAMVWVLCGDDRNEIFFGCDEDDEDSIF